jgi:hypothetical protein
MPRRLTATERSEREYKRMLENLRNEVRKTLERDSQKLLESLRQQLAKDLQNVFTQATNGANPASGANSFSGIASLSRIAGSLLRLSSKPRISSTTFETTRSQDAMSQFRLSRGQIMAEMNSELSNGEKNL